MMVVCARESPRSAIISTRSRKLSLYRRYQRTQSTMISWSKCRPLKSPSISCALVSSVVRPICQRLCCVQAVRTRALWRAVDAEGEVLDVLVQSKRNKHAALKLMRKLLKKYAFVPERLVTGDLRSYS